MQRWNYKLKPNQEQSALMSQWLVTLRKHRNYALREREDGWNTNNKDADNALSYAIGAYCEVESRIEYGSCCPLTCPVVKHGVMSAALIKTIKETKDKPSQVAWDSAGGIQSKRTTELRRQSHYYKRIDSAVLQRNLAKLDAAFTGFWSHKRGFPAYRKASNFKTFEYKPGRCKFHGNRVYLPGLDWMRYFNSRPFPDNADIRTVTVIQRADGWYISVLLKMDAELPDTQPVDCVKSIVGIDVGINKLVALSDGSFVENPKLATSKRTKRRLRIRQRRVSRKQKGSINRTKAAITVARFHKQIADKREAYQWSSAKRIVKTANAIAHEDLNIAGLKKRCKPKRSNGRFMPNGQSAKRGLNRAISDASWGSLFDKIAWLALKVGKPVVKYNPRNTSRECSACGHVSKDNRDGEKFICSACGHIDHADTQAARTGLKLVGLLFPTQSKKLPADCGKVTLVSYASARNGEREQGKNLNLSENLQLSNIESSFPEKGYSD